jgi:hypothetical protein
MNPDKTVEILWQQGRRRIVNRGDYRMLGTRKVRELRLESRHEDSTVWCLVAAAEYLGFPRCGYNSHSQALAHLRGEASAGLFLAN